MAATIPLHLPYQDTDGSPLNGGYLYFGVENQNAITNPVAVYWDAALTQPAAQPIRTLNGYTVNNGNISQVYVASKYSLIVRNSSQQTVYSEPSSDFFMNAAITSADDGAGGTIWTTVQGFINKIISSTGAMVVGFIQDLTGAVLDSVGRKLRDTEISIEDFMLDADRTANYLAPGSVDVAYAVQAAYDSLGDTTITGQRGSRSKIKLHSFYKLGTTVTVRKKSVITEGNGWGVRGTKGTGFIWGGIAGIPMFKVQDAIGFGMKHLRFIGSSAAKPSAALNFNETNDGWPISGCNLENILFGALSGETDDAEQFTDMILLDGTGVSNAEHQWKNLWMRKVTRHGIHIGSTQNVNIRIDGWACSLAATGALYNSGRVTGSNWTFALNAVDLIVPAIDDNAVVVNGLTKCDGYFSELAGRMADISAGFLNIEGGSFNITSSLNADGKLVKADVNNSAVWMRLTDFRFLQASAPPTSPYLAMSPGSAGTRHIILDGMQGWTFLTGGKDGMDVATTGVSARAYVRFSEATTTSGRNPPRTSENLMSGNSAGNWSIRRRDSSYNDISLRLFDHFTGHTLNSGQWAGLAGTDPQAVVPTIIASQVGGWVRLTTGDDAAATMAVNGSQMSGALNWTSNTNPLIFECKVKLSAITNVCVFVGFTNQIAALQMPFEMAAGDTLISNASNATGVLFDTAADTDNWWLVGVAANVDAVHQNTTFAPVAATFETFRVEFEGTTATFYRNDVLVGTAMTGAIGGATLAPVVTAFSRGAASRTIDVDYVLTQARQP